MYAAVAGGTAAALTVQAQAFPQRLLWVAVAAGCQLRLLTNMLDGMVAIQSATASPVGELYNEVPDRVSDVAIFLGLGYAAGGSPELGYLAALLAVLTAYIRAACKVAGAPQDYCGPMAKPQRMFLVTLAALYMAAAPTSWRMPVQGWGLPALILLLITFGCLITCIRRLLRGARHLRSS